MLENRLHRVWIVEADRSIVGVMTMTDVIRAAVHGALSH